MYAFFAFRLENNTLDHTTLYRFRNEIVVKMEYERLLKKINKELKMHQAIVKTRVIIDSSITVRPFNHKEDPTYVVENQKKKRKKQISQRKARVKEAQ
ncbi:MAG: hypothetical protein ACMUEL_05460 [Flavobacteriales bacterium Tduv]